MINMRAVILHFCPDSICGLSLFHALLVIILKGIKAKCHFKTQILPERKRYPAHISVKKYGDRHNTSPRRL